MMMLSQAAAITDGAMIGGDCEFASVTIDSRTVAPASLFVAIPGERFDGHDFVGKAAEAGAFGVVVEQEVQSDITSIRVADTTIALGQLARNWRQRFSGPVLGITGSNGKTTVTAMVRTILASIGAPLSPQDSYNNQWGVPLTLLKLQASHSHAVIEMGMNHAGELDYLTKMALPDIALINNAAAAHIEGLGGVEQVAQAKSEIIAGVPENGTVVLNADDAYFGFWQGCTAGRKVRSFSIIPDRADDVDVYAGDIEIDADGSRFALNANGQTVTAWLQVAGKHNVANATAAAVMCLSVGVPLTSIAIALADFEGVPGRLQTGDTVNGARLIDDSFNANPSSTVAAIDVLAGQNGKRILVLGAMAELGSDASNLHREVGSRAKQRGIHRLMLLAEAGAGDTVADMRTCAEGYGASAELFGGVAELVNAIGSDNQSGSVILVKGSKSSRMGRVCKMLRQRNIIKTEEIDGVRTC